MKLNLFDLQLDIRFSMNSATQKKLKSPKINVRQRKSENLANSRKKISLQTILD